MTAICCMESDSGVTVQLERDALRPTRSRAEARVFVQNLWDSMPRTDDTRADPELLASVRRCVRRGDISGAQCAIDACSDEAAETFNLRGVVSELNRDFPRAERAYKTALARDPLCSAAKFNLRRCYELWTFGRSDVLLCL